MNTDLHIDAILGGSILLFYDSDPSYSVLFDLQDEDPQLIQMNSHCEKKKIFKPISAFCVQIPINTKQTLG